MCTHNVRVWRSYNKIISQQHFIEEGLRKLRKLLHIEILTFDFSRSPNLLTATFDESVSLSAE
jgi:hypothetical protein